MSESNHASEANEPRWIHRPPGSNWGDFGADDQCGRINLLTPQKVKQGVAEVQEGLTFCLSLPLDLPGGNVLNPRRLPPVLRPTLRNGRPNMNYRLITDNPMHTDVISDDLVVMHLQYSTQWDSLAHVGQMFDANGDGIAEAVYYNGFRAGRHILAPTEGSDAGVPAPGQSRSTSKAAALGIENMAARCVQGRGVMIDLQANLGRGRSLVGYDSLMQWITDSGLSVLIADNYAVEAHPAIGHPGCCATLPLHEHCLFKLGVHLGEIWHLSELANWLRAHGRSRFLLTAPPLRLPGAVGSPATPVATV